MFQDSQNSEPVAHLGNFTLREGKHAAFITWIEGIAVDELAALIKQLESRLSGSLSSYPIDQSKGDFVDFLCSVDDYRSKSRLPRAARRKLGRLDSMTPSEYGQTLLAARGNRKYRMGLNLGYSV